MPYLNNHFHVYDVHKNISFQIVGKTNFINWLNAYTCDRLVDYGRYKYFTTYSELDSYLKFVNKKESVDESV
tara:strand:+ start:934 stop:1149 length:216 start_codon:yes stop_codon:yes gene_type:complete